MSTHPDSPAIACSLSQDGLAERRRRWLRLGAGAAVEISPTATGLRLLFRQGPGVEEELRELTDLERECCAFAAWSVRPAGERLVLEVGGEGAEAVAAVQGMFAGTTPGLAPAYDERGDRARKQR